MTIGSSVTNIGEEAFYGCNGLTNVTIPNSVSNIGNWVFWECTNLTSVFCLGNAPTVDSETGSQATSVFQGESGTAYYLPGTMGWGATFGGWPTAMWYQPNPQILGSGYGFGTTTNGFCFTISWATNLSVIVQACTDLAKPVWLPVATNTLVNGTNYFSDSQWTNYPKRFYRLTAP